MKLINTMTNVAAAALLTVAGTSIASAAPIEFTFGGVTQNVLSDTISNGGIDLTITSAGPNAGNKLTLFINDALGVGDGATGPGTDAGDLMSAGESLSFMFTPSVDLLESIIFESRNGTDTVRLTNVDAGISTVFDVTDQGNNNDGDKEFELNVAGIAGFNNRGSTFLFETLSSTGNARTNRGVALLSLTVAEIEPDDATSPVPVPASLPLLLAGVGGLVAVRRRKAA